MRITSALLLVGAISAPLAAQTPVASKTGRPVGAATAGVDTPTPIAFAKVDRKIGRLPELRAAKPLYGLLLFGKNATDRVWIVLDKSTEKAPVYDVLYIDRDADGDLTEPGERITAKTTTTEKRNERDPLRAQFVLGEFVEPGRKVTHTEFEMTWTDTSFRLSMLWRNEKRTFGVFGPTRDTYVSLAASPAGAPILVPGWDRPFQFQHWMSGTLRRGGSTDFKVFVGNRGDRTGAFLSVDDDFLPVTCSPIATLIYTDTDGKEQRHRTKLVERC